MFENDLMIPQNIKWTKRNFKEWIDDQNFDEEITDVWDGSAGKYQTDTMKTCHTD